MNKRNNKITNKFYKTQLWVRNRNNFIINNPMCKMCEDRGIVRLGKYVDHIIPIEIDYELRLDVDNFQTLCAKCHGHKTQQVDEQLKKGLSAKPLRGTDVDGLPTDINHHWNSND